jgi:hypothetical protein
MQAERAQTKEIDYFPKQRTAHYIKSTGLTTRPRSEASIA